MPPTINSGLNADRDKVAVRPGERRSELVCRVKYCNTLPDIPFDPKFIQYPFPSTRFIEYNPTSLERNYKYEVLTEHDLGVTIDLINRDTYACELGATLDPADEKLLEEDAPTLQDSKRSRHHAKAVSWLRRTEYISTEQTRFQPQSMDKVEAKVGFSIKKDMKEETLAMDRDAQLLAIEKTFEDAKKPIEKHYSKPNVVPVEVLPVFPDFKVWKYPCAQVMFDSDPAPIGRPVSAQIEMMSQAMIRGVKDETGEQFVAYFLPTEDTLEKRKADFIAEREYLDDEEYEYKMAREYNWNVKSKTSGKGYEENYFLVVRQEGIYYNELETRVRLSKRRQKAGIAPNNTRLVVRHCPLSAQEFKMQRYRERQLEAPNEEEEDEEEEEEDEQAGSGQEGGGDKSGDEVGNRSDTSRASRRRSLSGSGSDSGKSGRSRSSSRSGSGSRSRSRSKSGSRSRSRSKSGSRSRSASGSPARSGSGSPKGHRSRSGSPARSERSGSGSPARSARSGSGSPARSGSGSPARSARSASGSPARSERSASGSPARSKRSASGSPARSGSGSPAGSARSGSASPAKSSGSGSGSVSGSGSDSGSDSD